MWGEDDIDDVLEKLKFEDALKEIRHNQEKLLQNQTGTQQSLTAIDELLNKRLQKRQEALQIAAFSSVSTRRSPRSSMTPVSMDSTPTIVSCTSTPVITPPSSRSISLPSSNRSNSHLDGVDKNPCLSLDDRNDLTSFNARNNEDTPIVFEPSEFEKGMLTSKDNEIRNADVPEDFKSVVKATTGVSGLARKFGLTPDQLGENLRGNYQGHETEQHPVEPDETAENYLSSTFSTVKQVLEAAQHMVAMQIARDPLVRQCVRQAFYERAKLKIKPTKKGKKETDESHSCSTFKYIKNKPVKDLKGDQFLHMCKAEEDGLLTISIGIDLDKSAGNNNDINNNINNNDDDDDDLELGHPQSASLST